MAGDSNQDGVRLLLRRLMHHGTGEKEKFGKEVYLAGTEVYLTLESPSVPPHLE